MVIVERGGINSERANTDRECAPYRSSNILHAILPSCLLFNILSRIGDYSSESNPICIYSNFLTWKVTDWSIYSSRLALRPACM